MKKLSLRFQYLAVVLTVIIGFFSSIFLFLLVQHWTWMEVKIKFEELIEEKAEAVQQSIQNHLDILYFIGDFYAASHDVERREFDAFVSHAPSPRSGTQSLNWVPRIQGLDRPAFEESVRSEGYADFMIWERNADGEIMPAGKRREYFPVYFIEPMEGNEGMLGWNMASDPILWQAMERARDDGLAIAGPPLGVRRGMGKDGSELIYYVFYPIYRNGLPHATLETRRLNLQGFIVEVLDVVRMVTAPLTSIRSSGYIEFFLYDRTFPPQDQFLFSFQRLSVDNHVIYWNENVLKSAGSSLKWSKDSDVAGRQWTLTAFPTPFFLANHRKWDSWAALIIVFLFTILLAGYLFTSIRHTSLVERLVAQRTVDLSNEIADRKQAEKLLRKSEERLSAILNNTTAVIYLKDLEGRYLFINRQYEILFHVTNDAVLGKTDFDLFPYEMAEKFRANDRRVLEIQAPLEFEEEVLQDDGIHTYLSIKFPLWDLEGQVCGIATDITARKQAEKLLREQEAVETQAKFVSMVSHELRTPLHALKDGISIVLEGLTGPLNPEQREFLALAKSNVDRLARLINEVLDFQKADSHRQIFDFQEQDINGAILEAQKITNSLINKKGLTLKFDLTKDLPPVVIDKDRIIQVLINLISNAIKFTRRGEITVKTQLDPRGIEISVTDSGIGIKQEDLAKLFQPFSQVHNGNGRKTGSSGLGLAISKKIVERHGGQIGVQSQVGNGSTFFFLLPVKEEALAHAS